MRYSWILTLTFPLAGFAAGFDLNQMAPGPLLNPAENARRARLFTDAKPVEKQLLRLRNPAVPSTAVIEVTQERELRFIPVPGTSTGTFDLLLDFPKSKRLQVEFSLKTENFFIRKTGQSRFSFNLGGVNLMVRGDTGDLRYFDAAANNYQRLVPMRNGEWIRLKLELECGDSPVFSLNDRKNIPQRGKCDEVKAIQFTGTLSRTDGVPAVFLKNLKITERQQTK